MANITFRGMQARESHLVHIYGQFTGNGSGTPSAANFEGDLSSVTRTDTGDYTVTMKDQYPDVIFAECAVLDAATDGKVVSETISSNAQLVLLLHDGNPGTPKDSTSSVIQIHLVVRNTGLSRQS